MAMSSLPISGQILNYFAGKMAGLGGRLQICGSRLTHALNGGRIDNFTAFNIIYSVYLEQRSI
jgi:hypothetical protein